MHEPPTPLAPFTTGNAKADAAIAKLADWELSYYDPNDEPLGKDREAAVKAAEKAGVAKLAALLDSPATLSTGKIVKLGKASSPKQTKERETAYNAAIHGGKARRGFLTWLMRFVLPDELDRVFAIAANPKVSADVRIIAVQAIAFYVDDKARRMKLVKLFDVRTWDAKGEIPRPLEDAYLAATGTWLVTDPAGAWKALAPLVAPNQKRSAAETVRAELVATAVFHRSEEEALDKRWIATMAAALSDESLDTTAQLALEKVADDELLEAVLATLDPDPAKVTYTSCLVETLARVADARVLPYLAAGLPDHWLDYQPVFEAFRKVKDPAMAHVVRTWLAEHGDGPNGSRTKAGTELIAALEKRGKVPASATVEKTARARPGPLVFEKVKGKAKKVAIPPIAKQRAGFAELFAELPKAMQLVEPAVALIPTRVDEKTLALGATKLGGHPDLPAATPWPKARGKRGEPLEFLAQLDLAAIAKHLPKDANPLPASGLLAIFASSDPLSETTGYLEHAAAIHTKAGAKLVRREVPDDYVGTIYQACSVEMHALLCLPSPTHPIVSKVMKSKADAYGDLHVDADDAYPLVLGYRNQGYEGDRRVAERHLLQLTGELPSDMQFGDDEYVSFYIDGQRLAKGDFSKIKPAIGD